VATLRFHSDDSVADTGFHISWAAAPGENMNRIRGKKTAAGFEGGIRIEQKSYFLVIEAEKQCA
jgi:hypothetical protein